MTKTKANSDLNDFVVQDVARNYSLGFLRHVRSLRQKVLSVVQEILNYKS